MVFRLLVRSYSMIMSLYTETFKANRFSCKKSDIPSYVAINEMDVPMLPRVFIKLHYGFLVTGTVRVASYIVNMISIFGCLL